MHTPHPRSILPIRTLSEFRQIGKIPKKFLEMLIGVADSDIVFRGGNGFYGFK
jgi:hypothetical protein